VVEIYEDLGRALPLNLCVADANHSLWLETRSGQSMQ
jgi:antitoxin HicB